MVMLNSALTDETVPMGRYTDITAGFTKGRDVVTDKVIDIKNSVTVPAKGEYVLELGK